MVKKWIRSIVILFITAIIVVVCAYFGLSKYYENGFAYGTWINGIYCTGKTINEVNNELTERFNYDGLTIFWGDGKSTFLHAKDVGYTSDFNEAVSLYLKKQNPYKWYKNLFGYNDLKLNPVVTADKNEVQKLVMSMPFVNEQKNLMPNDVILEKTSEGYLLHDGTKGILNMDAAVVAIYNGILNSASNINLEEAGCFYSKDYTDKMQETIELWNKLDAYQSIEIIYVFDDENETISKEAMTDFIALDEKGQFLFDENNHFMIDKEKTDAYVDDFADRYDTFGKPHLIHATRGTDIIVEGGTYGNLIDREAEKEYLYEAILSEKSDKHEPVYKQQGRCTGKNDIGDTYVEVDITEQKLYYYVDGEVKLETPVVTGNELLKRDTPCGVNFVYFKQKNRVLRGPGYASPVKFWMAVNKGIGIHDASWRSDYGEEIYKTNGSHGCINTPYDIMEQLYEMADLGTPVIILK